MADFSNEDTQLAQLQNEGASPSTLTSPIREFYAGTKILITGATGFLGKALAEKLLRSCKNIDTIYYLVRSKRGMSIEERHEKLLTSSVFDILRVESPESMKKLVPVRGDVAEDELGLSPSDREMLIQNINVVFHSAATVKFDENIQIALNLNTFATIKVLELCKSIKNLKALVYVSTAYSNADKDVIKEEVYPSPAEMETLLEICKMQDIKEQDATIKALLGKHPNTYTLTKAMAECAVNEHAKDIPLCIVRPSMVTGALNEPIPGWIDNFSALSGFMIEIGRGTLRSVICKEWYRIDVIPVDIVVNTLIAAAWRVSVDKQTEKVTVYNCTSGTLNPISWLRYGQLTAKYATKYPSQYIMFYPGFKLHTNYALHHFMTLVYQILPALLMDTILYLSMKKTYATRLIFKFIDACLTGRFFAMNEWRWEVDNMINLQKVLSQDSSDAENFSVDVQKIDWERYVEDYIVGLRVYTLKDPLTTLPEARRKQVRIWWITGSVYVFLASVTSYGLYHYVPKLFN